MQAKRVDVESKVLLDPTASQWRDVPAEEVALAPTPANAQPSRYTKLWASERPYGKVGRLTVRAAHNSKDIAFLLEWQDASQNVDFLDGLSPDAAGILFPVRDDAPLGTMGSKSQPVNAWFWRADAPEAAQNLTAAGLGTVEAAGDGQVTARGQWQAGTWRVVLSRALGAKGGADVAVGKPVKVAFAVWDGANGERAGLKAFSKEWRQLDLGA